MTGIQNGAEDDRVFSGACGGVPAGRDVERDSVGYTGQGRKSTARFFATLRMTGYLVGECRGDGRWFNARAHGRGHSGILRYRSE